METQNQLHKTPKLLFFSFPLNKSSKSPEFATPPVNVAGSIPFLWEEVPGKPRAWNSQCSNQNRCVVRCLELPPKLLSSTESCKSPSPSPTTVLEKGCLLGKSKEMFEGKFYFSRSVNGRCEFGENGFEGEEEFMGKKVKISRVRRKGSLFNLSTSKLSRVYEGFRQVIVIPWRRRQARTH